jgi:hypothetical protein
VLGIASIIIQTFDDFLEALMAKVYYNRITKWKTHRWGGR